MQRRAFMQMALAALAAGMADRSVARVAGVQTSYVPYPGTMNAAGFHAARQYAHTPFGDIAYVERGSGAVTLFLHGFPLNGFQWRGALARLSPYRRCIAPDWMGLGYTRVAEGQHITPATQAEMLIAFLEILGIDRVDLVANDSGGAVAQLFMTRHPERVRSLLLTNCDVEIDSPPPAVVPVIAAAKAGRFADDTFRPQLADKTFARSAKGIGGLCFTYPGDPTDEAIDVYFTPLVSSPRRVALTNAYAMGLAPNPLQGLTAQLKRCTVPVRLVWGMSDTIFTPNCAEYLLKTLPNLHGIRRIPEAKLFFPEEFPDVISAEAKQLWGIG